jgi:signal transduction histidine kinase
MSTASRRTTGRLTTMVIAAVAVAASGVAVAALVSGEAPDEPWAVAAIVAAVAVGAAGWPLARAAADRFARRHLGGSDTAPDELVRQIARRHDDGVDEHELLAEVAGALLASTGAQRVEMWRIDGSTLVREVSVPAAVDDGSTSVVIDDTSERGLRTAAVLGPASLALWGLDPTGGEGDVRGVPIVHGQNLLGLVVVTRAADAPRFSTVDDVGLAHVGPQLGIALHNRELDAALRVTLDDLRRSNQDLRASRQRLVASADDERRRIERNLHDGAQQHLVALAVSLRLAEDEIARDPQRAAEVFGALSTELKEAMAELRTLAHGIYPPLLKDAGLVEALRNAVGRTGAGAMITDGGVGRYDAEVEAAVYFCCLEAVQNAVKHAPGSAIRVALADDDGVLSATVDDEGPGLDTDEIRTGHGLGNMADRAGAVGGALDVGRNAAGGTRITISIPVSGRSERSW